MDLGRLQHIPPHRLGQWREQACRLRQPVAQRRAREVHTFAGMDLALPVKRLVIGELAHGHMSEQACPRQAARDRPRRRGRL